MMNNIPYNVSSYMPYNPAINNDSYFLEIKKNLDIINHELEQIEKRLTNMENNLSNKNNNYLSSDIETGKGLYML